MFNIITMYTRGRMCRYKNIILNLRQASHRITVNKRISVGEQKLVYFPMLKLRSSHLRGL